MDVQFYHENDSDDLGDINKDRKWSIYICLQLMSENNIWKKTGKFTRYYLPQQIIVGEGGSLASTSAALAALWKSEKSVVCIKMVFVFVFFSLQKNA